MQSSMRNNATFTRPTVGRCYFCAQGVQPNYQDAEMLRKFISMSAKILSRRRSGTCAKHQRQVAKAIKRARVLAILPITTR